MKRIIAVLLLLTLAMSFAACGGGEEGIQQNNGAPDSVSKEEVTPTAPPKPVRPYPNNILMGVDKEANYETPAFGSETLKREDVTVVTFLDTLANMPADAWDASLNQDGSVMAWSNGTELFVAGEGGVTASNCYKLFFRFRNLKKINFNDCFYTDISESMYGMFGDCYDLEELDLSFFVTSQVLDMSMMFEGCSVLKELDLSSFDTENVLQMHHMFFMCDELQKLDVSSFNTAKVKKFGGMFSCEKLETLDVSHFDTSSARDMSGMFFSCGSLKALNLSNFNTAEVDDMTQMFMECKSLTELDLSSFDTSKVTRMGSMFYKAKNLKKIDVSSFNTSACTKFGDMFGECSALAELNLSSFDFSQAESTAGMFTACYNLTDVGCQITVPDTCDTEDMYLGSGLY